jgi:multiple sugar transport system substrate-binding protein/raffinose/stachyose/melibiose transport system substrate-binding protein
MRKAANAVAEAGDFAFNDDLATRPAMAEKGLTLFSRFLLNPADLDLLLEDAQATARQLFVR